MNFGYGPATEVKRAPADAVELVPVLRRSTPRSTGFAPDATPTSSTGRRRRRRSTAGSWPASQAVAAAARAALDGYATPAVHARGARRSSTTSRTGTSAARAPASGRARTTPTSRPRSARSGTALVQTARADRAGDAVPGRGAVAEPRHATSARTRRTPCTWRASPRRSSAIADPALVRAIAATQDRDPPRPDGAGQGRSADLEAAPAAGRGGRGGARRPGAAPRSRTTPPRSRPS